MLTFFLREVLTNIKRNPLMSITSVTTVMVLTLLLGYFVALVMNLQALTDALTSEIQVIAYLKDGLSPSQRRNIHSMLLQIPRVKGVHFVSKHVAFARLMNRMKGKIQLDDVSRNPLPDSFEITTTDPNHLKEVAYKVSELPGIEKVKYGKEIAQRMMALNRIISLTGIGVLSLLFLSTILIISNTIRLTVFARRREIDIMQMVGAAAWFIRMPFVLEGILQGLLGSSTAALIVGGSYKAVVPQLTQTVPFIPILSPEQVLPALLPGLILLGGLTGAMGSLISVNRFLKI